jgi:DNA-directed RNA polymerase specialized sigma24 family protein
MGCSELPSAFGQTNNVSESRLNTRLDTLLQDVRPQWLAWLRRRLPGAESLHNDIVQDAAGDLLQYVSTDGRSALPDDEIRGLGFTILRRRAADATRRFHSSSALHVSLTETHEPAVSGDSGRPEEYQKLLRAVIELMGSLDTNSRELLVRGEFSARKTLAPLSGAQRQKLSRLRLELRRKLAEQYHLDVESILKD